MRVICIDNKNPMQPDRLQSVHWVYEGEIYTVIDEKWNSVGLFYTLAERNFGSKSVLYNSRRFIPLSEINEIEELKKEEHIVTPAGT